MQTPPVNLQQKAYDCLVRVLCDGDNPRADQHRRGVTIQELEAKYQELFIGPVAHDQLPATTS